MQLQILHSFLHMHVGVLDTLELVQGVAQSIQHRVVWSKIVMYFLEYIHLGVVDPYEFHYYTRWLDLSQNEWSCDIITYQTSIISCFNLPLASCFGHIS